jgi:opacity protein-like surface antigen
MATIAAAVAAAAAAVAAAAAAVAAAAAAGAGHVSFRVGQVPGHEGAQAGRVLDQSLRINKGRPVELFFVHRLSISEDRRVTTSTTPPSSFLISFDS